MFKNKLFSKKISKLEMSLRLGFYILGTLIVSVSIILVFFLYNKFYLTLTQAEEIIILKSQMAINSLNLDLFQKVKTFETNRQATSTLDFNSLKNPFAL
ncbi:MAG TPA: hypothetical protein PKY08_02815 [Candidatus Magasanikbacteria bacterium]|nr:hypothetical protein [Candidatus Magasanikbacteria bacterium]